MSDDPQEPDLTSRGLVRVEYLCQEAKLDLSKIRALVEAGRLEGLVDRQGFAVGLFDDALPTAEELRAMGVTVGDQYRPEDFVSYVEGPNEEDEVMDEKMQRRSSTGSTWIMGGN